MPKIAITGKGGVGKTTLAALLAHIYAAEGRTVLAIDADRAAAWPTRWASRGSGRTNRAHRPDGGSYLRAYRRQPGTIGGYFRLNPRVDDIPDP